MAEIWKMPVNFHKLNDKAVTPTYGTEFAAGADLYYCGDEQVIIPGGETCKIGTGIACEIPVGLVGLVFARSGLACKMDLAPANKVGVIDSDYRGEVIVMLHNHGPKNRIVEPGERVAQIVFVPYVKALFNEVSELNETARGDNGFGSTGK